METFIALRTWFLAAVITLLRSDPKCAAIKDLPPDNPLMVTANSAADDLGKALAYFPATERSKLGRIAWVWSFFEAALQTNPQGSNDQGGACGVMQTHVASLEHGIIPSTWTCEMLRADRVKAYRTGIAVIRSLQAKCGSLRAAMHAYSTNGQCPTGQVIELVKHRCALADGAC